MDKLQFNHNYVLILIFCLLLGFVVGYNSRKQFVLTQTKIDQTNHTVTDTKTITQSKNSNTTDTSTNFEKTEISYNKDGHITKKTIIKKIAVASTKSKNNVATVQNQIIDSKTHTVTQITQKEAIKKYLIAASINPVDYKNGVNITIGVQLVSGVFLTTSSDINKFTPKIGITLTF